MNENIPVIRNTILSYAKNTGVIFDNCIGVLFQNNGKNSIVVINGIQLAEGDKLDLLNAFVCQDKTHYEISFISVGSIDKTTNSINNLSALVKTFSHE